MHGDFSQWFGAVPKNQVGILAQEGRILLDADVNAQTMLEARWQDLAARASFGAGIAAIPADHLDAWQVKAASISSGVVTLTVMPGAAWADGLLVELEGDAAKGVTLTAAPLGPPLQDPPKDLGAAGTRDAVILEVWRRSLNGYQVPGDLIEPALGGPDTAERIETAYALRLYRMADADTCRTLDLNDDLATHGHLTATIAPTTMTAGDCPVVQGGGYTGLEHDLYRIEIADVTTGGPMFKWSQWNGGLVGRGEYVSASNKLILHAGDQAILRSGLTTCYVEALVFDASAGHWRVAYGATATIDMNAGEIDLAATATFGAPPDASMITNPTDLTDKTWFIRVWNDLRAIADFPDGGTAELRDGIRLAFGGVAARFIAGDYWTFPVRAQLDNPATLLSDAPPFGVHHHRVPLAELDWNGTTATIEDCRIPLHPITATDGCCTHSVGDGITSHGDFTTVQAAIDALPGEGGRVCVLPGTYTENVSVLAKTHVEIIGCGPRSKIIAKPPTDDAALASPAIYVLDTSGIKIEKLHVEAGRGGIAILLEADDSAGSPGIDVGQASTPFLEDMRIADCEIVAGGGSGIEIRGGQRSELVHNHLWTADVANDWALITVTTDESRIAHNVVTVTAGDKPGEFHALGGIWLRGGCTRIDVVDNTITNGAGHGVMLGHAEQSTITGTAPNKIYALAIKKNFNAGFLFNGITKEKCVGCGPGPVGFPPPTPQTPPWVAGDPLSDIRILDNDISEMGISGVGVMGFFPDARQGVISIDRLEITHNRMFENIVRGTTDVAAGQVPSFGYGAVSLADVTDLVVRDNVIRDNGTRALGQVCGIYVQTGSGVDVSRNRIYDNGPVQGHTAATLPHGGIWLDGLAPPLEGDANTVGRWSAAVHDNEVQSNNGPGLVMKGLGHFSIVANAIATRSSIGAIANKSRALNVLIVNNSTVRDVSWASYSGIRDRSLEVMEPTMKLVEKNKTVKNLTDTEAAGAKITIKPIQIEAAYTPPPGSVIFANNQVNTYVVDNGIIPAVTIYCLCDVGVSTNHFLTYAPAFYRTTPVWVTGAAVHVHDNRFIDPAILASATTFGYTNITTHNTADHCILVSWQQAGIATPNIERSTTGLCKQIYQPLGDMNITIGGLQP